MKISHTAKYKLRMRKYQFRVISASGQEIFTFAYGTTQLRALSTLSPRWQETAACIGRYEVAITGKTSVSYIKLIEGQTLFHSTLEELIK